MFKQLSTVMILVLIAKSSGASHNCTFEYKIACYLTGLDPQNEFREISLVADESANKTADDILWMYMDNSHFKNLSKEAFVKFGNIQLLSIKNCTGFKKLSEPFIDRKLIFFLMDGTDLEVIGEFAFKGLSSIESLLLQRNKINKIHKNAFSFIESLVTIKLSNNNIESLDEDIFANNLNLSEVELGHNKLTVISSRMFSRNINVETVKLTNNQISLIEKNFQMNLTRLVNVDLSSNLCISESFTLKNFSHWSEYQIRFEECNKNFAMMKSTSKVIRDDVESDVDKVNNGMKILEEKLLAQSQQLHENFRHEFSSQFTFIYCFIFATFCLACGNTFYIMHKFKIIPRIRYQNGDARLLASEMC